ncbi:hypothetical protein [Desulfonatronum sp. SC1]|uniref:hypothetical protein n=1 Tax=Desulfonatronum sp. SC1 TaxID=2109626 RepID=UPI000D2F4AF0|nr:hypothetical protein [Desulfonatronum sp. SC1]PTN38057.1 hypothetical protein C6366_04120 [Desulfonatronum sp. SC1]
MQFPADPLQLASSRLQGLSRVASLMLIVMFFSSLWACGPSQPRSAYPPPDTLRMAEAQRHEFIQLFLQGRWCEAQGLFERSLESYHIQDDFCSAAQNHLIAWKLHQYLNLDADHHLSAARDQAGTGLDCPGLNLPDLDAVHEVPADDHLTPRDRTYRKMIDQGAFTALTAKLRAEPDPLFSSVYGRKAAKAALDADHPDQARTLIHQTRELDAEQGWIVFLIEDWSFILSLTPAPDEVRHIQNRIGLLRNLIQPCSP